MEPQPIESAPTEPNKIGWFPNNANQCRDTTENCLLWNFHTAGGDRGLVTFTDTASAGWSFACVIAYAAKVTYGPSGLEYEDINDPLSVLTGYSCSPTQLTFSLDTSVLAADQIYYFEMLASASAPGGDGGIRYTNTVQVTEGQNPPTDLSAFTSSAYVGGAASGDGIRIYKRDAAGNDANTTTTAVTLPNGTTELSFLIRNTGTTDLTGITVTDTITQGSPPASVSGLSCNFSEAVDDAPTSGTTWAGPFPTNSGFTCSATLSGVQGYSTDVASVAATGNGPVGSSDPYVAFTPVVPKVSIGDYVWYDINRNGLQDDNSPASGVTVTLKDEAGSDVGTAVTNADGYYWFTDLVGGAAYTLVFTAPDGYSWTTKDAGGVSDNNLVTDTNDSDVTPTDGMIAFTAPLDGDNVGGAPGITDNPTLDGGLVKYDLTLTKTLVTAGPYRPGQTVVYTLTPQNLGPAAALPGWSVTDVLPSGLTAVGISGSDSSYSCELSSLTCTNDQPFPAAADLGAVTVTATIDAAATAVTLNNLGYVTPADTDVPETIPLGTPPTTADATPDFDANATDTNNDANAPLTLTPYVSVGDYVWLDTNRDGLQSDGEDPVSGVVVNLYDAAGVLVGTTTTNDDGFYVFTDLLAGAAYTIEFVKPDGTTLTTPNVAGGDDALDSDAPADTGKVEFIAPASGTNSASEPDNPTIDAGLVKFNLSLSKALSTSGAIHPGDVVSFILTPHNDGPADALAGWTVTEVLPGGLSLVSMSGAGYSCSGATCIAAGALPAGSDGPTITVVAKVTGTGDQRNVAYIDRATGDGDEVIPLGPVPPSGTDTEATPTDNDAMADLVATSEVLPQTGADLIATATLGFGLILLGGLVVLLTGRGTRRARQV